MATKRAIKLTFAFVDGGRKTVRFASVAGAANAVAQRLGHGFEVGTGYAVAPDGVVTATLDGATWDEIRAAMPRQPDAPPALTACEDYHEGCRCPGCRACRTRADAGQS